MTLKSHCTHQRKPTEPLWYSTHCTRPKTQHNYLTRTHLMDQRRPKSHRFRSCLMFCLKDRVKMDQIPYGRDAQAENTDSKLRELALKWFTETQAPLILHNGNFPEWFQGFISRKDAEENLKDKELGCFLIRLSEKATGYILSYKGRDRCRHFVINQNKDGRFIVTGDTEMHETLTSLIEFYKNSPIEPFGEYLRSSCFESCTSELYDVIHVEQKAVNVKAVKEIWTRGKSDEILQPPALPPKSNRNTQKAPPVPFKGLPLKTSSLEARHSSETVLYTEVDVQRPKQKAKAPMEGRHVSLTDFRVNQGGRPTGPRLQKGTGIIYSEVIVPNCRSQSLPLLDDEVEEKLRCQRRSQPQLYSHLQRNPTNGLPGLSTSLDKLCNTSLYQLAGTPGNQLTTGQKTSKVDARRPEATYTKVSHERVSNHFSSDNTYEQIPDPRPAAAAAAVAQDNPTHTNTYEMLPDLKPKQFCSARGVKAEKWKWLSPEYWKK